MGTSCPSGARGRAVLGVGLGPARRVRPAETSLRLPPAGEAAITDQSMRVSKPVLVSSGEDPGLPSTEQVPAQGERERDSGCHVP